MRRIAMVFGACVLLIANACAQNARKDATAPATMPASGKLPHIQIDLKTKQVRVEGQALRPEMPLEFLAVVNGGPEHEAVFRSAAKPSNLHLALLMIGLTPGEPVHWSPATQKWIPPHGPPLQIFFEYEKDTRKQSVPAYRWMRDVKTKAAMPVLTWIFAGSRVMDEGVYAADVTGYLASVVNFDLTVIDIPKLASNANETLEWEMNPDVVPPLGTPVTMVIEPAGELDVPPDAEGEAAPAADAPIEVTTVKVDAQGKIHLDGRAVEVEHLTEQLEKLKQERPLKVRLVAAKEVDAQTLEKFAAIQASDVELEAAAVVGSSGETLTGVAADEARIQSLRERWKKAVAPHDKALREAAQAHYEVVNSLRREQQRLVDEADRIQRLIDELEKDYQEMTTPRPEPVGP